MKVIGDGSNRRGSWDLSIHAMKNNDLLKVIRDVASAAHGTNKNKIFASILGPSSGGRQAYHADNKFFLEDLR
jgi:hypothetical protein